MYPLTKNQGNPVARAVLFINHLLKKNTKTFYTAMYKNYPMLTIYNFPEGTFCLTNAKFK